MVRPVVWFDSVYVLDAELTCTDLRDLVFNEADNVQM